MRYVAAFDYIRTLSDQIERLWLENEFHKSWLINDGISAAQLQKDLTAYCQNPENQQRAQSVFAPMEDALKTLAEALVTEEVSQQPPPKDQSN